MKILCLPAKAAAVVQISKFFIENGHATAFDGPNPSQHSLAASL